MLNSTVLPKAPAPGFAALASNWNGFELWVPLLRADEAIVRSWIQFMQIRFKKDADLLQRLVSNASPATSASIYIDFWQQAVQDYSEEVAKLNNAFWSTVSPTAEAPSS